MIRISHLNAALTLTSKLDAMGYKLLPILNTPLSSLNSDIYVPYVADSVKEWTPHLESYISAANAVTPGQDVSVYVDNMDKTSRAIATYVQSHLSFAKNVVKPIISELVECFTEKVNSVNISPSNDFKIIKQDLPAPMLISDIKDAIDEYEKVNMSGIEYPRFNGPDKNIIEIVELMKTGNEAVDTAIDTWVVSAGDSVFTTAYDCIFGTCKTNYPKNPVIGTSALSWNTTLAVFLMARNLHNKPWDGCNMSLVEYNVKVGDLRDWAGCTLSAIYKSYATVIRTAKLIESSHGNTITVNAPVYEQWISEGNNDLILLGTAVKGTRSMVFVSEINAAKIELMRAWEMYAAMAAAGERNKKFNLMRSTLHSCVYQIVEQNADRIFGHLNPEINPLDHIKTKEYITFKEAFEEYYLTITEADFIDIWALAKHIVCNLLFYYTDACDILDGIEDACKNNPDLQPDEAALLSTIRYVTKYVSNQIVLSKI